MTDVSVVGGSPSRGRAAVWMTCRRRKKDPGPARWFHSIPDSKPALRRRATLGKNIASWQANPTSIDKEFRSLGHAMLISRKLGNLYTSEGPDEINQIAFSADGSTLLSAGKDRRLRFWSWATGLQKKEVLLDAPLGAIAVARNGRIAVGSDKDVVLLDKAGKELKRLRGHDHQVTSLAFSSDSQSLVSGSLDWTALVWDMP